MEELYKLLNSGSLVNLDTREIEDVVPELLDVVVQSLKNIHKITVYPEDIEYFIKTIKTGNKNSIWYGSRLITKIREIRIALDRCVSDSKISDSVKKELMIYYRNLYYKNPLNNSQQYEKIKVDIMNVIKEIQNLCSHSHNIKVELEDIKDEINEYRLDTVGMERRMLKNLYYNLMNSLRKCNFNKIFITHVMDTLIRYIDSDGYYDDKKLKLETIKKYIDNMCTRIGKRPIADNLQEELFVFLRDAPLRDYSEFFQKLIDVIEYEAIPLPTEETTRQDIIRELKENPDSGLFENVGDVRLEEDLRKTVTLRRLNPKPPQRYKRPTGFPPPENLPEGALDRDEIMKNIVGVRQNLRDKGTRLLLRTSSMDNPTFTGYFHPYIVDTENERLFECGMKCHDGRPLEHNKSIKDACELQKIRRMKDLKNKKLKGISIGRNDTITLQKTEENYNRCRNVIGRQLTSKKRKFSPS